MSTTRTWKCPECGLSLEISYDWLAKHGGPVCEHCDGDMELQTADDHAADVERLVDKAEVAGLQPEDLDDIVHELAASVAADVNNSGLEGQIAYLVDGLGVHQTEQQIDELIDKRRKE
jgi:uncharacterized Zn finger protein (UPF0148 family)